MGTRWERRLVSVVAGPGFGKTVLLATAAATEAGSSARVDVWLTCEPADAEAEHLLAGLVVASGLPADGIADLSDRVWAQAPRLVCFLLDDVHEVPEGSDGARLLGRLLTELPGNGRLVLASREPVPVPVSRLAAAGQVTRITERDLVFDSDEATAFAEARALPPDRMAAAGGWPALAELAATAGADLVPEYLWDEVLDRVGTERARLLAAFEAVGGGGDDVVGALARRSVTVDELVAAVPLVARAHDGEAALHPLWRPALRRLLAEAEVADVRRRAGSRCRPAQLVSP